MNAGGLIEYRAHPFWPQKYCPSHEHDGTPRCCSCEKMEVSLSIVQKTLDYEKTKWWWHLVADAAGRCQIFASWGWKKALSRVFGLFDNGHSRVPASLPWNTRLLRRPKHEGGAASSFALSRKTSSKRSHGRREKGLTHSSSMYHFFLSVKLWCWCFAVDILWLGSSPCVRD